MQGVALGLMFQHAGVGAAKLCLVESLAEAFGRLGHFLVYLIVVFGNLVFYQHIGTIAFL